ncbi:hypothetical protein RJT34_03317 [Clitoria ternatea]|uniref:Uncharacterized protein n=1 Tax=Clitoria ternatea TaxID=43366 RepID=A0AAN9KK23_CLITE
MNNINTILKCKINTHQTSLLKCKTCDAHLSVVNSEVLIKLGSGSCFTNKPSPTLVKIYIYCSYCEKEENEKRTVLPSTVHSNHLRIHFRNPYPLKVVTAPPTG